MDNKKINQKNVNVLSELTDKVSRAVSMIFTDYRGLTHKQLEDVRKKIKKVKGDLVVTKNTLLLKALTETKKAPSELVKHDAPTATLFAYEDAIAPLKELVKFFKVIGLGSFKGGILEGKLLTIDEVDRLATLPSRPQLIAQLVGQLKAPLYGLHNALSWNMRKLVWTLEAVKSNKAISG